MRQRGRDEGRAGRVRQSGFRWKRQRVTGVTGFMGRTSFMGRREEDSKKERVDAIHGDLNAQGCAQPAGQAVREKGRDRATRRLLRAAHNSGLAGNGSSRQQAAHMLMCVTTFFADTPPNIIATNRKNKLYIHTSAQARPHLDDVLW